MHSERGAADQASGLRRLLSRPAARVWAFIGASPGAGVTRVVTGLAQSLATEGCEVLVLDEHLTQDNVANRLFLKPRFDLLDAVRGDMALPNVLLDAAPGLRILPTARVLRDLQRLGTRERQSLASLLDWVCCASDVILVDAASGHQDLALGQEPTAHPLAVVTDCSPSGIKAAYALIKRFNQKAGVHRFGIVLNRVRHPDDALAVFDNLSRVARDHLDVGLACLGIIPVDEPLTRATQLGTERRGSTADTPVARALRALGAVLTQPSRLGGGMPDMGQTRVGDPQEKGRTPLWAHAIE